MISPTVAVHVLIVVALQVQETLTNPNSLGSFLFRLVISEIIHLDNYVSYKYTSLAERAQRAKPHSVHVN